MIEEINEIFSIIGSFNPLANKITDKNLQEMRANMDDSDLEYFDAFVEKYWGDQIRKEQKAKVAKK